MKKEPIKIDFHFAGESKIKIRARGWLCLPVRFRKELAKSAKPKEMVALPYTLDQGIEAISMYPREQYENFILKQVAAIKPKAAREAALIEFVHCAEILSIGSSGLFCLPPLLQEIADLKPGAIAVVSGLGYKVQLANEKLWPEKRFKRS